MFILRKEMLKIKMKPKLKKLSSKFLHGSEKHREQMDKNNDSLRPLR